MLSGFPTDLIGLILCPKDGGTLVSEETGRPYLLAGTVCCKRCQATYEIRDGILRLLPGQESPDSREREEQKQRDAAAGQYDAHFSDWANCVEMSALFKETAAFFGKTVLDLACGTGRITCLLLPHARTVLAADFSLESLRILAQRAGMEARLGLIWSDVTQLRLAPESVDVAVSTQLLEHIPTPDQRAKFLRGVHSALAKDGIFLLSVYYYSALRRLLRRRQEGLHANGIFYHRFTREEITGELSDLFRICMLRPMQVDPRLLRGSLRMSKWAARNLEKTFVSSLIGQLLFVKASKQMASLLAI